MRQTLSKTLQELLGHIQMPSGMIKANDRKLCPPSSYRMKLSMESCVKRRSSPFLIETWVKLRLGILWG